MIKTETTMILDLHRKIDNKPNEKATVMLEVVLDYYLPSIMVSVIYATLFSNIGFAIYSFLSNIKINYAELAISISTAIAAYGYVKSKGNNELFYILPFLALYNLYQTILTYNEINNHSLIWILIVTLITTFTRLDNPKKKIQQFANNYLHIEDKTESDFKFLLNNCEKNEKNVKLLIAICHYNNKFEWLEKLLSRKDIDNTQDFVFYRCLPFCWIDGEKSLSLMGKYQMIQENTEQDIYRSLLLIETLSDNDFPNHDLARKVTIELLSSPNKKEEVMKYIQQKFKKLAPIIESVILEKELSQQVVVQGRNKIAKI